MAEERVNEFENRNYPTLRTERKIMIEKWTEIQRSMGYHQVEENSIIGEERVVQKKIIEEKIAKYFPNLKNINCWSRKLNKPKGGYTQRKAHLGASESKC